MASPLDGKQRRRDFFRAIAGGLALAATAALAATLVVRRLAHPARSESCTNRGLCGGCPTLDACGLPRALSARQVLGRR